MKVTVVLGTRPEIIKMFPVVSALKGVGAEVTVLFTGQHFSDELGRMVFDFLGYCWEDVVVADRFDVLSGVPEIVGSGVVVVHGDTTSTVLGAIAAVHNKKPLVHVEAGLRSMDFSMREERNRRMVDQASDVLFCPLDYHARNCESEGCAGVKCVVGNTIVDVVTSYFQRCGRKVEAESGEVVVTLHRKELVDDVERFHSVMRGVASFLRSREVSAVYPMHPGVRRAAVGWGRWVSGVVEVTDPVSPMKMWDMISRAPFILTDSGGLQEEACILGVPCFTLRSNTERPETIALGSNVLVPPVGEREVFRSLVEARHEQVWEHPYGKDVGGKIASIICDLYDGSIESIGKEVAYGKE